MLEPNNFSIALAYFSGVIHVGSALRAVGRVVLRRPFGIGALGRYRGIGREQASPEPSGELMLLASWCCWREYLIRARN